MAILLVTYDVRNDERRSNLLNDLKAQYDWALISESSYVIDSREEPSLVFQRLEQHIAQYDRLAIFTVQIPWRGYILPDAVAWLNEKLL